MDHSSSLEPPGATPEGPASPSTAPSTGSSSSESPKSESDSCWARGAGLGVWPSSPWPRAIAARFGRQRAASSSFTAVEVTCPSIFRRTSASFSSARNGLPRAAPATGVGSGREQGRSKGGRRARGRIGAYSHGSNLRPIVGFSSSSHHHAAGHVPCAPHPPCTRGTRAHIRERKGGCKNHTAHTLVRVGGECSHAAPGVFVRRLGWATRAARRSQQCVRGLRRPFQRGQQSRPRSVLHGGGSPGLSVSSRSCTARWADARLLGLFGLPPRRAAWPNQHVRV